MIFKRLKINASKIYPGEYNVTNIDEFDNEYFVQHNNKLGLCGCQECAVYFDNVQSAARYIRTVLKYKKRIAPPQVI